MFILSIASTVLRGLQEASLQMVHSVKPTCQHAVTLVTEKQYLMCLTLVCGVIGDCTHDYPEHLLSAPGSIGWFPGCVVWTGLLPYCLCSRLLERQIKSQLHINRSTLWCPSYPRSLWISTTGALSCSSFSQLPVHFVNMLMLCLALNLHCM